MYDMIWTKSRVTVTKNHVTKTTKSLRLSGNYSFPISFKETDMYVTILIFIGFKCLPSSKVANPERYTYFSTEVRIRIRPFLRAGSGEKNLLFFFHEQNPCSTTRSFPESLLCKGRIKIHILKLRAQRYLYFFLQKPACSRSGLAKHTTYKT